MLVCIGPSGDYPRSGGAGLRPDHSLGAGISLGCSASRTPVGSAGGPVLPSDQRIFFNATQRFIRHARRWPSTSGLHWSVSFTRPRLVILDLDWHAGGSALTSPRDRTGIAPWPQARRRTSEDPPSGIIERHLMQNQLAPTSGTAREAENTAEPSPGLLRRSAAHWVPATSVQTLFKQTLAAPEAR